VRTDKSPPVAGEYAYPEAAQCGGCGAVYLRKTWRRSEPRRIGAYLKGAERVLCPACRQVGEGRAYGRVLLRGEWLLEHEAEVRRRIAAVESRARHTQPERRIVAVARRGAALEVTTTSQKLAHRVARELEKAFGGEAAYAWSDRDGSLRATWSGPRVPVVPRSPGRRGRH
jgi:NMD protein affecting ribosome stability and mRNA decay